MSQQMAFPQVPETQMGDVLRVQTKPDWKSKFINPKMLFIAVGVILLSLLSLVPIWNAAILLQDSNYVFWAGKNTPIGLIAGCVFIVLAYAITVGMFFKKSGAGASSTHIEQTIMMIANIFIMLFGLFLMMASLPLTHQSELTQTNLMHRCEVSEQTHRLFEYSQVLNNIRRTPACAAKYSIEECAGYEEAAPYTNFLKGMENNFRCSGFCTPQAVLGGVAGPAPAPAGAASPAPAAMLLAKRQGVAQASLATEAVEVFEQQGTAAYVPPTYPPTLYSDMNFQASCDGMAARDIKNFAGDIGQQTFLQGIYLVIIAVLTGMLKLVGLCIRKV